MTGRPLTQKELEDLAEHLFDDPEQEIEETQDSVTEQENSKDSEGDLTSEEFFIGKNKSTQWHKSNYHVSSKTKRIKIVKGPNGVTQKTRGIENEQDVLLHIIDIPMIDKVLKYTNMYIDQLKVQHQNSRDQDCKNIDKHEFIWVYSTRLV